MILYAAALSAAEALERNAGPRAALPAFRTLATSASDPERSRAMLAGIRCAIAVDDRDALDALVTLWPTAQGAHFDTVRKLVLQLFRNAGSENAPSGDPPLANVAAQRRDANAFAWRLAQAEANRSGRALAAYVEARVAEKVRPDTARALYEGARTRAEAEGDARVYGAATTRLLRFLSAEESEFAATLAKSVDVATVDAGGKLAVAAALLAAKSRFSRAAGLTLLQELLREPGSSASAKQALIVAAKAADRLVATATPLEVERLRALFAATPNETLRATLVARLEAALSSRASSTTNDADTQGPASRNPHYLQAFLAARDALAGTVPSYAPNAVTGACLAAIAHLEAGRAGAAELALAQLAEALGAPDPLGGATNAVSALLERAFNHENEEIRGAALRCAVRFVALGPRPRRGFLPLAKAIVVPANTGRDAPTIAQHTLADAAQNALLEAALRNGEEGADTALYERSIQRAWALREEAPETALAALRRAETLASSSTVRSPK